MVDCYKNHCKEEEEEVICLLNAIKFSPFIYNNAITHDMLSNCGIVLGRVKVIK